MSPQKRKKLSKIRSELDKIDNSLIKIIKKRTFLVKKVLELKDRKNQIVDQKRIRSILSNIRKKSLKNKIDPRITSSCLLYTSPSPRDKRQSRMPSSA